MVAVDRPAEVHPHVQSTEKWVHRQLERVDHERRVARLAARLLAATSNLITLDARHRRLLTLAALVHDVGRSVNDERHPQIGAKLIAADDRLDLSKADRRALCYLTRYHRGAVPRIGKDDWLQPCDDRRQLYTVLAYLRAADALDSRGGGNPSLRLSLHQRELRIVASFPGETARWKKLDRRRRKLKLLEEVLQVTVRVSRSPAETTLAARG